MRYISWLMFLVLSISGLPEINPQILSTQNRMVVFEVFCRRA